MPQLIVADDNAEFVEFLTRVAASEGWAVQKCNNGKSLVERVNAGDGAVLLIIDINMPVMDGIEAIAELVYTKRPMRIRFISGGATETILAADLMAKARSLNVGRSLYKPVALANFKQVLSDERKKLLLL